VSVAGDSPIKYTGRRMVTAKEARMECNGSFSCFSRNGGLNVEEIRGAVTELIEIDPRYVLLKIDLVHENGKNGSPRVDVYLKCETTSVMDLSARMSVFRSKLQRKVRYSIRNFARVRMATRHPRGFQKAAKKAVMLPFSNICVWSWNVNGTVKKRSHIELAFTKLTPDFIGLQETRRGSNHWDLHLNDYTIVTSHADTSVPGARGVAIAIKPEFQACVVGDNSPYWIFCKIFGEPLNEAVIMGSVYIPTKSTKVKGLRNSVLVSFQAQLRKIIGFIGDTPLIITGDFNCSRKAMAKIILSWDLPLTLLPVKGDSGTFNRVGRASTDIDHILISNKYRQWATDCVVFREVVGSDHYPLKTSIAGLDKPRLVSKKPKHPKYDIPTLKKFWSEISNDNRWSTLSLDDTSPMEQISEEAEWNWCAQSSSAEPAVLPKPSKKQTANEMHEFFVQLIRQLATEKGALNPPQDSIKENYHPKGATQRLIARRIKLERLLRSEKDEVAANKLKEELKSVISLANDRTKAERVELWNKRVVKSCCAVRGNNAKAYWAFVKKAARWRTKGGNRGITPIKNPVTGVLETDAVNIGKVWFEHFRNLASDPDGKSKNAEYWATLADGVETLSALDVLNTPITWDEVCETIHYFMKLGKAPGDDSLQLELYKLLIKKLTKDQGEGWQPASFSPMSQHFFDCILKAWEDEELPKSWSVSEVVAVPKKGDLSDVDNYRGISLMAVAAKVFYTLMQKRLTSALCIPVEADGKCRLTVFQGGFRPHEEAVGQATALYEILMRRKIRGLPTWTAFIDMQKAFDSVPHEALMMKVEKIGVRGKFLNILRQIYSTSTFVVRGEWGTSEMAPLLRGVRQGCPLSPILFNIFINDLLDGTDESALLVPGLWYKVAGLLFADDLCLMASCPKKLQTALDFTTKWADKWGMSFGHKKCNVVVFRPDEAPSDVEPTRDLYCFMLQRAQITIADHYTYLGLVFHSSMCLKRMTKATAEKGMKVYHALKHFMGSTIIPTSTRLMVLKACLIPVLTYGGELWGMRTDITRKLEKVLHLALRRILNTTMKGVSFAALRSELKISSIMSKASELRVRALNSWGHVTRTVIRDLVRTPLKDKKWTWVSGGNRWMHRHGPSSPVENIIAGPFQALKAPRDPWMSATRRNFVKKSQSRKDFSNGERRYLEHFANKQTYWGMQWLWITRFVPRFVRGFESLARARIGGLITTSYLVQIKKLDECFKNICPFCDADEAESMEHYILACPRWTTVRDVSIAPLISEAGRILAEAGLEQTEENVLILVLGGNINGNGISGWYIDNTRPKDMEANKEKGDGVELISDLSEPEESLFEELKLNDPFLALIYIRFRESGLGKITLFLSRTVKTHNGQLQKLGRSAVITETSDLDIDESLSESEEEEIEEDSCKMSLTFSGE
jgi:exonuclease III